MLARADILLGDADNLVIAMDRIALGDRARCHLVARRNQTRDHDILFGDARSWDQLVACDDDVVARVQADHRRRGLPALVFHARGPLLIDVHGLLR